MAEIAATRQKSNIHKQPIQAILELSGLKKRKMPLSGPVKQLLLFAKILSVGIATPVLLSCMSSQAQTRAASPINVTRNIDWRRAEADLARLSSTGAALASFSVKASPALAKVVEQDQPSVPLLLPQSEFNPRLPNGSKLAPGKPIVLFLEGGYAAVIKSQDIDIVIDASDTMVASSSASAAATAEEFIGEIQSNEGGGKQISIGRYGALYSIQLICNRPSNSICVTDELLNATVASLAPSNLSQREP